MKIRRVLAAGGLAVAIFLGLPGCATVSVDKLKASDSRILLLKSDFLGDSWVYEDKLGMRTPLKSCVLPDLLDRCFTVPGRSGELRYPLLAGPFDGSAKLSGLSMGEEFHCGESGLIWDPKLICAIV